MQYVSSTFHWWISKTISSPSKFRRCDTILIRILVFTLLWYRTCFTEVLIRIDSHLGITSANIFSRTCFYKAERLISSLWCLWCLWCLTVLGWLVVCGQKFQLLTLHSSQDWFQILTPDGAQGWFQKLTPDGLTRLISNIDTRWLSHFFLFSFLFVSLFFLFFSFVFFFFSLFRLLNT